MLFWIILDIVFFFVYYVSFYIHSDENKFIFRTLTFFLAILSGFRYKVGMDYDMYENIYMYGNIHIEPMFPLLIEILNYFSFSPQMFFLISSIITHCFIYKGLRYYVHSYNNLVMAIILYALMESLWFNSLTAVRQFLAISIFFWSSKYIINQCFWKYFICWIIMISVHYSAIPLILCYWIGRIYITKIFHLICIVCSFVIILNFDLVYVLESIFTFWGFDKYIQYLLEVRWMQNSILGNGTGLAVIFSFLMYIVILYSLDLKKRKQRFCCNMLTLFLLIRIFFSFSSVLVRMQKYGEMFCCIGLVYFIYRISNVHMKTSRVLAMIFLLSYSVIKIHWIYNMPETFKYIPGVSTEYRMNFKLIDN